MYNKVLYRFSAALFASVLITLLPTPLSADTFPRGAEPPARREALPEAFLGQSPPAGAGRGFSTDFSRATISFADVISGGPPKDGIPAVDEPKFVSLREAREWIEPEESVFLLEAGGEAKIYPVQILMWHEIVNDEVGGVPVTVTYCPLCNTGVTFMRRYDGGILDFGVSGRLRFSNMIMYDRQTESWWQQANGRAIAGEYAGGRLARHPMLMLSFAEARQNWPRARVLSRDTGYSRAYGRNPYGGYDTSDTPFLYRGPAINGGRDPMTRVVMVEAGGEQEPFAYPELQESGFAERRVGGVPIVVLFDPEAASPLDAGTVAGGREVGAANAFVARIDGRRLRFEAAGEGRFRDRETGSVWNAAGRALSGEFLGRSLQAAETVQHFWFSYFAFEE
jgi:hypothetical protein